MKTKLILSLIFLAALKSYSQCDANTFNRSDNNGTGGVVCLEGSPEPYKLTRKICFENYLGDLNFLYNNTNATKVFTFKANGSMKMGSTDSLVQPELLIVGANLPANKYTSQSNIKFQFDAAGQSVIRASRGEGYDSYLQFLTTNDSAIPDVRMVINSDGKVIIGDNIFSSTTINIPGDYKLYVDKGILAEKVKVALKNSTNWADNVFENDYNLMPMDELRKYIQTNRHLPNVPSADELVKDGLDLGQMQAKQMEKIEELTLYMLQMKAEIDALRKENEELKQLVKQ